MIYNSTHLHLKPWFSNSLITLNIEPHLFRTCTLCRPCPLCSCNRSLPYLGFNVHGSKPAKVQTRNNTEHTWNPTILRWVAYSPGIKCYWSPGIWTNCTQRNQPYVSFKWTRVRLQDVANQIGKSTREPTLCWHLGLHAGSQWLPIPFFPSQDLLLPHHHLQG